MTVITETEESLLAHIDKLDAERAALSWAQWVSVAERLPTPYESVIVNYFGDSLTIAYHATNQNKWVALDNVPLPVTHWMELPPPPTESP